MAKVGKNIQNGKHHLPGHQPAATLLELIVKKLRPPYLTGKFVVASLESTDPAQDDSTYSISLENDGEITFDDSALTGPEAEAAE